MNEEDEIIRHLSLSKSDRIKEYIVKPYSEVNPIDLVGKAITFVVPSIVDGKISEYTLQNNILLVKKIVVDNNIFIAEGIQFNINLFSGNISKTNNTHLAYSRETDKYIIILPLNNKLDRYIEMLNKLNTS